MTSNLAAPPPTDYDIISFLLRNSESWDKVCELSRAYKEVATLTNSLLSEAARFADSILVPLNAKMDREGVSFYEGKVATSHAHKQASQQFIDMGWTTLSRPQTHGGQEAPLALWAAIQGIFDRSCPAFGMLPVSQISAVKLIAHWASDELCDIWLPKLIEAQWGATICISEVEVGSDIARLRTKAIRQKDGNWKISGEKCWISYGSHDLSERIGHCLLAKAYDENGTSLGISLFLVPDRHEDDRGDFSIPNGVFVRRLEEKMGLHGSPTCSLGFENAQAFLLGEVGRGLAQMFVMITNMRLSVAIMGAGIASNAFDVAKTYSFMRKQGGAADRPPVDISRHIDVKRMLFTSGAQVNLLRSLIFTVANYADLAVKAQEPKIKHDHTILLQFLLPIIKTIGGEIGFDSASIAMQILGDAGYTKDWPVEQAMRDARVLTIFEGTSGIQALDLLHRRLGGRDAGAGLQIFLEKAYATAKLIRTDLSEQFIKTLQLVDITAKNLINMVKDDGEAGADAFLHLVGIASLGWVAARLLSLPYTPPTLHAEAHFFLMEIVGHAQKQAYLAQLGAKRLKAFDEAYKQ